MQWREEYRNALLRVLHIGSGNLYGGVETALVALARFRNFCPAMAPHFAICFEGRLSRELEEAGVAVHYLGEVRTRKPWTVWAGRRRLRELQDRQQFDVVICHMAWPMTVFGRAVRLSRTPLIFWAHDAFEGSHWLERWAARTIPDAVIANSLYTQQTVRTVFPNAHSRVIYYPVMPAFAADRASCRTSVRRELGISEDTVVIIQVSRMEAYKGHSLHLEGLARIQDNPHWICLMVGGSQRAAEQAYMTSLERRVAELGISKRVRFLGQRSDVSNLLLAADIFSQPNIGPEPFGIVFVEGLLANLPVVTTAIGGPMEIIDQSCGLVVPPEDPEQLGAALRCLIDSPERRNRLGQAGPERARALCDPARRIPDVHHLLRTLTKKSGRQPVVVGQDQLSTPA